MLIHSVTPENQQAVFKRAKENSAPTDGLKVLGAWTSLSTRRGFRVIETDDPLALKKSLNYWRDIIEIKVEPILDQEENLKALGI